MVTVPGRVWSSLRGWGERPLWIECIWEDFLEESMSGHRDGRLEGLGRGADGERRNIWLGEWDLGPHL